VLTWNVVKLAKLPTVRKKKRRRWTSEEARRFLASARDDNDPFYAAYGLVLIERLRKGEFLGLAKDAVDFGAMTIRIENQLQRVGR
jgi:integrase